MRAAPRRPMLAAALAVGALASPGSPPLSDLSWPCAHNKGADETAVPHGALANGGDSVPATMLPLTAGGAACLDGSPYGFYFVPSASSSKWTISFEGGGWCYNETYCADRSHTNLGSSTNWRATEQCRCLNVAGDGLDEACNCLYLPYCDGASFAGYRRDPVPVPGGGSLTFRGIANLDRALDYAFAKLGIANASEVVVSGGSAGGLATFLHADRIAERMGGGIRVTAAPDVGFFLDHGNYAHTAYPSYPTFMKYMYTMQQMRGKAAGGALSDECLADYAHAPHLCFMAPHAAAYIRTPTFVFNSKFDMWQTTCELYLPCYASYPGNHTTNPCSDAEQAALRGYGSDFLSQLSPFVGREQNGAFISTCVCHGCNWPGLSLEGRTSDEHYARWYHGVTKGAASVHVDRRGPNGDGALTAADGCAPFP